MKKSRASLLATRHAFPACFTAFAIAWCLPVKAGESASSQVRAAIANLWKGWETGDRKLVEPVYHPRFTDVDFDGVRRNREAVLAFLPPAPPSRDAAVSAEIKVSDIEMVQEGPVVIASYVAVDTRRRGESIVSQSKFRANDTFVLFNGKWKLLSGQQTLIRTDETARESERAVLAAQSAFADSLLANDTDAAARTLHDRYLVTAPAGWSADKKKFLADMKAFWKPTVVRFDAPRVTVAGSTAVVNGRVFYAWNGGNATEQFTDTYLNQYGRWLRVASHSSCLEGQCTK
jgi:hypothetical protein